MGEKYNTLITSELDLTYPSYLISGDYLSFFSQFL